MSRALIVINGNVERERAASWCRQAAAGTRVEFKASKRSLPQNAKLWAMLSEVAVQLPWHGQKLKAEDWKLIFLDALKREQTLVPNIEGTGVVNISGYSSSDLTKDEMGNLLELISEFGARHGVKFQDAEAA
jgi:hypothetical protein